MFFSFSFFFVAVNIREDYGADLCEIKCQVKYEDGDAEKLALSSERVTFYISREEMRILNLTCNLTGVENEVCDYDYDEMVVLAASLDDSQEVEAGDIIWAKLTGT